MISQQIKIAMVAVALVAFAYIVPHSGSFVVLLATRAMAFAILAMSVDLLLGYTGMSSMGQAAYFGVGAYLTAVLPGGILCGLGMGTSLVAGTVAAHRRMPLSLSFDHRCITGGEACRFLAAVIADLEKPD